MDTLDRLIADVRAEADRSPFPVDSPVYEKAGKDPLDPVLCAGNLEAPVCIFARDLGRDEVAAGQPLIGAGGRLVRLGLLRSAGLTPDPADPRLERALGLALLTNTVPYKPPGNKAYPEAVKARFRPFLARLLVDHCAEDRVICLGTEAFQWFAGYAEPGAAAAFWAREDRYEAELPCVMRSGDRSKPVRLAPLPHPSPLNQRWYSLFPALLDARLAAARAAQG